MLCLITGEAVPMSFDHKPMNKIEHKRIRKAGGTVDFEGRVNGGLNLSRAIGDHNYKQNELLSDKEQMITALPDVKRITVNPHEDEFMVLACDGIWDCYSNQEVVDFVKKRLETKTEKLSQICEEVSFFYLCWIFMYGILCCRCSMHVCRSIRIATKAVTT